MFIGCARLQFNADWVHSLKEKRMIVKSLIEKTKHKFNVSVAEVECQDIHQTAIIGVVCVTNSNVLSQKIIDNVIDFMEMNTDAVLTDSEIEIMQY